jgi:nitrite reductase/ring-hydroxylating ferredoxin subunit/Fe-S cluster biogenesis protein NfuA
MTAAVEAPELERLAQRVDDAVRALADLEPSAREAAEELKAALEEIHRVGLVTMVKRLRADEATREALFELVDDPVVRTLFTLHGIIRPDPVTLAERALQRVRPQLHSHGGDVTLVRVEDAVAYVRLEGACNGCSMSAVTLRELVETALLDGEAGVSRVEVLPAEPTPTLISVDSLLAGGAARRRAEDGWVRVGAADLAAVDDVTPVSVPGSDGAEIRLLLVNLGQRVSAYRNECAHEALPLDGAVLDVDKGTLTCPWHGFCYDATSGECMSAPGVQLEPLPLRVDDGEIWVRVTG